jgi:hypothetical protein
LAGGTRLGGLAPIIYALLYLSNVALNPRSTLLLLVELIFETVAGGCSDALGQAVARLSDLSIDLSRERPKSV